MREAVTKTIGESTYSIIPLGGRASARALTRLLRVWGSGVAGGNGSPSQAFGAMLRNLTEEDTDYFIDLFAPLTTVRMGDKTPTLASVFEVHFVQKADEMVKWLLACLELNWSSFFEDMGLNLSAGTSAPTATK